MFLSHRPVQIEWGDCDPAGIVFFPRYFVWFDASTAHHFKAAGLAVPDLVAKHGVVGFPIVETRASFRVPSRFGDDVTIETEITRFGRSSFDVEHRLLRGRDVAVEGFETRVLVRRRSESASAGLVSCPIPEAVKALFDIRQRGSGAVQAADPA
ncbi:MAG: thioesterase family protein [Paracoccaceae bacterium]|nr:thioesterase family protein [Paracoccaceae bacterium]MDE2912371.1 thioesterase family protein [Paracoccaceae bacterium]